MCKSSASRSAYPSSTLLTHVETQAHHCHPLQAQLLACINWLGEFQVLGCIPLRGHVPIKDVAELVGVPETQLRRIVRMTTTAGFLRTPQSAHVAHSALSAPFVTRPSYLDAVMFLSETAAPAALHMAAATQRFGQSQRPHESAYNVALNTSSSFAGMCDQRPKLQRQWPAYLRHALNEADSSSTDVLTCFGWLSLRNATVVEVSLRICDRNASLTFGSHSDLSCYMLRSWANSLTSETPGKCAIHRNSICSSGDVSSTSSHCPDK